MEEKEGSFKTIKLRQAVSVVVFQGDRFLMVVGKDWPEGAWCFPQGGINEDETHFQAAKRELIEELNINNFQILGKSSLDHMYLFPKEIQEKKGCEGQYQTIWFAEFLGNPEEISMNHNELKKVSWFFEQEVIPSMMYSEQKQTFEKVLKELRNLRQEKIL